MKISLCLLASFVLLLNSCSEPPKEGPLGMKVGQEYELSYYEYEKTDSFGLRSGPQTLNPKPPKKYYRAFVAKVVDVGPDWVEFQRRDNDFKFKKTGEEIQKRFINYKLQ